VLNLFVKKLARQFGPNSCENVNSTSFSKNCLLLYVLEPFSSKIISVCHQNQWQARELARIVGEFGFDVDVVRFDAKGIKLHKMYDLIIDVHPGFNDCYGRYMNSSCRKVAYITGSNPSFSNLAEAERLNLLYVRRGKKLKQRRYVPPFIKREMEEIDAMFFLGNRYNLQTYNEFHLKQVSFIRNTGVCRFETDDYSQKSPKNFLFLASSGQVHKGLDLLLDVFSENRDLNLFVCSSFKSEWDFCKLYRKELFLSRNIHPVGFVNIEHDKFREICRKCSYVVLPSCSEANAGSVLTGMAAGLIPVVSRESGFSEDEVHYFKDCSLRTIDEAVRDFAGKSLEWVEIESKRTLQMIRERYSLHNYSESVRAALNELLG
jgi:hypothetical protein